MARLTEAFPPLRNFAFRQAEGRVRHETKGHYPAPLAAIEALRAGFRQSPAVGFAAESAAIGRLADAPVTRECLRLFFLQEDAKKPPVVAQASRLSRQGEDNRDANEPPTLRNATLRNAAVLGAGAMGAGIALLMAQKGIWTRLKDIQSEFLAKGIATARKLIKSDLQRKRITPLQASDTLDRLRPATDYAGLKNADLIIEAIVERPAA